jgi:pimeloyl-ACP methyl ester carboxylesterase
MRVEFSSLNGNKLVGELDTCVDSKFAVVFCHGFGCNRNSIPFKTVAESLSCWINCLRVDLSGYGESQGEWDYVPYTEYCEHDIKGAVEYLRNEKNMHVIAVIGHSMGGNVVMMYASTFYGDVPCIINVCGRFWMKNNIFKHFSKANFTEFESKGEFVWKVDNGRVWKVTKASVDRRLNVDMGIYMDHLLKKFQHVKERKNNGENVKETRILTIHGDKDDIIDVEDGKTYHEKLKSAENLHTLKIIPEASHSFKSEYELGALIPEISAFLKTFIE